VTSHVPALVIGAGISGLVCAYAMRKAGIDAHIVESSHSPGRMIRSERRDGYLIEFGPQSFNATSAVLTLCRELHLEGQLVQAPPSAPRYVLINGKLRAVPLSPPAFVTSSLFNTGTKFRVLRDVFGHSSPPEADESIAAFVRRKFSPELLEKLVGPFVSGIYAGDPEKLSLRSAFPQLYEAEKSTGSVIRGLLRAEKKDSTPAEKPTLRIFRDGNQTLISKLAASLGPSLRCRMEARSVRLLSASATTALFEVSAVANGREEILAADRLIIAIPSQQAADLLRNVDPQFEPALRQIDYAPVAVVSLGYPRASISHPLNGFGFLVPRSSGLRILGTVWNSSLFAGRAPKGRVLLTSFIGGVTDLEVVELPESQLVATVHRELTPILGISNIPSFSSVCAYSRAIPQFNLGHGKRISCLNQLQARYPNLRFAGNYLRGPSLGACIEQALTAIQQASIK
jgi:protoporphyrinogen/coproporphyrinogen III oxidase